METVKSEKKSYYIKKGGNGGVRPGAGMPKGKKTRKTLMKIKAQEYLTKRIEEAIEPLATALIEKAIEKDVSALKEAFERGLGKVKEVHKMEGKLTIVEMASEITKKNAITSGTINDSK